MFTALIKQHLEQIKSKLKDKSILVYKGFPNQFIIQISKACPFVTPFETLFSDDQINLSNIKNSVLKTIANLQSERSQPSIILYEEFICLQKNINLKLFDRDFIVVENNFYSTYPNQSTEKFVDIQKCIELDIEFEENQLFSEFYVDSFERNGINYIQYQDIDTNLPDNLERFLFFKTELLHDVNYQKCESINLPQIFIPYNITDSSFIYLLHLIFEGKQISKTALLCDPVIVETPQANSDLKIIQYLFQENGVELTVYLKMDQHNDDFRPEYKDILSKHWSSSEFRQLVFYKNPNISNEKKEISQGAVIEDIVIQCENAISSKSYTDIFLTAPTGAGKSVLFQIPAIYLAEKYKCVTLVISPLKALMYDQVESLRQRGITNAAFINSDISLIQREETIDQIKNGQISILYLSPELLLSYNINHFIGQRKIGLLVVDEAHLVTTWGRDFRIDYWYLGIYIRRLRLTTTYKKNYLAQSFPVLAVTATAVYTGPNDIVFQTISSLNMLIPNLFIGNVRRDEIQFKIETFSYTGSHEDDKLNKTRQRVLTSIEENQKTIFYFPWISQIEQLSSTLPQQIRERVGLYYGSVQKEIRQDVIDGFKTGRKMAVLATKAFGMGVDISDITLVYHHAPSGSLSDYIQEIGRVARDKKLKGIAQLDYHPKDLKFTKVLYGLSSIKQYQVKLALQKLNDVYRTKRSPNFLISIEDFGFIFNEFETNLEQKVKSSLLLLEKDLIAKYGYNVIVVRPKSLFSLVFAKIDKEREKEFISKYGPYIEKIDVEFDKEKRTKIPNGIRIIPDQSFYSMFKINLDRIWEQSFKDFSFPYIKKRFFDRDLFPGMEKDVIPQFHIRIDLKQNEHETSRRLLVYMTVIEKLLMSFEGKFFTKDQFEMKCETMFKDTILRKRIVDSITSLYTSFSNFGFDGSDKLKNGDTFLQVRRKDNIIEMRMINSAYTKVKHDLERIFVSTFSENKTSRFQAYIPTDSTSNRNIIKLAYVLESFDLGNYELIGGQLPQLFIRINDPFKLNVLARSNYTNEILIDIDRRQQDSIKTMQYFFETQMETGSRWNCIEEYFLGKTILFSK